MEAYHFFSLTVLLIAVIVVCVLPAVFFLLSRKYRRNLYRAYRMTSRERSPLLPDPAENNVYRVSSRLYHVTKAGTQQKVIPSVALRRTGRK